jgi:hypothetical protein
MTCSNWAVYSDSRCTGDGLSYDNDAVTGREGGERSLVKVRTEENRRGEEGGGLICTVYRDS